MGRGKYKNSLLGRMMFDSKYDVVYNEIVQKYPALNDPKRIYDVWDEFMIELNENIAKKFGFIFEEVQ